MNKQHIFQEQISSHFTSRYKKYFGLNFFSVLPPISFPSPTPSFQTKWACPCVYRLEQD